MKKLVVAFLLLPLTAGATRPPVSVKTGEVQKEVARFINETYSEVQSLKEQGFRQYYFFKTNRENLSKPIPVKKPDWEALQRRYLERFLKERGIK